MNFCLSGSRGFLQEVDRVTNRDDGLGGIIRNFDAEFFFESHDQFDRVEGVGAKIFDEIRIVDNLVGIDTEMINHNFLYALGDIIGHDRSIPVPQLIQLTHPFFMGK